MRIISYLFVLAVIFGGILLWMKLSSERLLMMQQCDTLYVGTNAEYPPFSYHEGDEVVGFDIDIIKIVADQMHKKLVIIDMPFDSLIPSLQTGMIHLAAAGMTPTDDRAQQVFFSPIYFQGDPLVIITMRDSPIETIEGLKNKRIVVNDGYTADYYITEHVSCDIVRLLTVSEALTSVQIGRADAFISARSAVRDYFKVVSTHQFNVAVIPDTQGRYALAVSKKYPLLADSVSCIVKKLLDDGVIRHLQAQRDLL